MTKNLQQDWFEMSDLRRRRFATSVWVPLRATDSTEQGKFGRAGYIGECLYVGSVAFSLDKREEAENLGSTEIGISHQGGPHAFADGGYKPCEVYQYRDGEDLGVDLVFEQHITGISRIWHLTQDLVLALRLVKDGDRWIRPEEDYVEVVRERRDAEGKIVAIEIRSEFLRDYLAARGMALRLAYYRQRVQVSENAFEVTWPERRLSHVQPHDRFEARVFEVDQYGGPAGGGVALFEVWRTDVDPEEDVPIFGPENDSNTAARTSSFKRKGPVFFRAEGELWREEWIEPSQRSERVRGDEPLEPLFFVIDAAGTRVASSDLNSEDVGRYLWFDARVINALANRRGGGLRWYTLDTGSVWCSPHCEVHFGVNRLGLINVYAYDIAPLPVWQQRIWAAHNVVPDGAVSAELLDAQMRARPARTHAPEAELESVINALDATFQNQIGTPLFRTHEASEGILRSINRFRAIEANGIFRTRQGRCEAYGRSY